MNDFKKLNDVFDKRKNVDNDFDINEERREKILSLRKKKMNEKLTKFRLEYKDIELSNTVFINDGESVKLNQSFYTLFNQIKIFYKDESSIEKLLLKILFVLEEKANENEIEKIKIIYDFSGKDLINGPFVENLYEILKKYLKNSPKIIKLVIKILLYGCYIIISDESNDILNKSGYFISDDRYLDIYKIILDDSIKDYNKDIFLSMLFFLGNIANETKENQRILYEEKFLEKIIKSFDIQNEDVKTEKEKIWFLAQFDLEEIFTENEQLSLSIQNIYIDVFLNQTKFGLYDKKYKKDEKIETNDLLLNHLKLIANTSYCDSNTYLNNLFKSDILSFLIDYIDKNTNISYVSLVIDIFGNITNANSETINKLINIGMINVLIQIIKNKEYNGNLRGQALWPINNLLMDQNLCKTVLFDKKIINLFCEILNDDMISGRIFQEISYGIMNVVPLLSNEDILLLVERYKIIQLFVKFFKNYIKNENFELNYERVVNQILSFLKTIMQFINFEDVNMSVNVGIIFQNQGGEEILDLILITINNNFEQEQYEYLKDIMKNIVSYVNFIKIKLKST